MLRCKKFLAASRYPFSVRCRNKGKASNSQSVLLSATDTKDARACVNQHLTRTTVRSVGQWRFETSRDSSVHSSDPTRPLRYLNEHSHWLGAGSGDSIPDTSSERSARFSNSHGVRDTDTTRLRRQLPTFRKRLITQSSGPKQSKNLWKHTTSPLRVHVT